MGAKQSKRSVDITSSPNKTSDGDVIAEGEGRVVKIGDVDVKAAATNGTVPHTEKDVEVGEKDENAKDLTVEKTVEIKEKVEEIKESTEVKENGVSDSEEIKTPDSDLTPDNLNESAISEKSPESAPEGKEGEATPETKKQKEKKKKKWSFRSISFSKKDKSKPSKEAEKNGDVKEVAEENAEDVKSPTSESPKTEKPETPAEPAPVTNGNASKEEIIVEKTSNSEVAPAEETKKEDRKVEEIIIEEPKKEAIAEEPKVEPPKVEEPKISEPSVESGPKEANVVKTPAEETKEVRNEEVPPPLPSSNPPSSLTAFAESTKADILNTESVDLLQVTNVVNSVLNNSIGQILLKENIVEPKKELDNNIPSDSPSVSSKIEIEPTLTAEVSKSEPLREEKSSVDLLARQPDVSLISELTTEPKKSDTVIESKSETKPLSIESDFLVLQSQVGEPLSEETEKSEIEAIEQPLVHEILSVESSEISETSVPIIIEDPIPEPRTIELNLQPLPRPETEQNLLESKDLQSNTTASELPEPVEVKKTPESIALISEEDLAEAKEFDVTSEESLSSDFLQTPKSSKESNQVASENPTGPQLTPVEVVIEDAKPRKIEQPLSEHSFNYSEESESIDLPPPQESEQLQQAGFVTETKSESEPQESEQQLQQAGFVTDTKSESIDLSPPQESEQLQAGFVTETKSDLSTDAPAPFTIDDECPVDLPSPTDLPPPSAALVDPADSLQDISTESLPSLPEPVSENLAEPMSLPPVDSVPESIATDCLPPESIPVAIDSSPLEKECVQTEPGLLPAETVPLESVSKPVKSDPLLPTECVPVLTNGSVNGSLSPVEVSPTTNGGSILLGEATPIKQVPQEVPSEGVKEDGEKPATTEVPIVEE